MSHQIDEGQLAGEYRTLLAASNNGRYSKQLYVTMHVDSDNAWSVNFEVREDGKETKILYGLSSAVREYNAS